MMGGYYNEPMEGVTAIRMPPAPLPKVEPIQKPRVYQTYSDPFPMPRFDRPNYFMMTQNNQAPPEVIEQLGGVPDTIKPMHESLLRNELRPYEFVRNYAKEIMELRRNPNAEIVEDPNSKILSASPFRASVQIKSKVVRPRVEPERSPSPQSRDELEYSRSENLSPMQQYKKMRQSPIRRDSMAMRDSGDDFLQKFTSGEFTSPEQRKPVWDFPSASEDMSVSKRSNLKRNSFDRAISTEFVYENEEEAPRQIGLNQKIKI